jgi:hypothetical protein
LWFDTTTGASYIYYNSAWVELGGGSMSPMQVTSSTRPSAPWEGQTIYETDTDLMYVYGGSAWQQFAGGTSVGNSGLVHITSSTFSAVSSVTISNCFSATYDNYHISFNVFSSSTAARYCSFQLCSSGTPSTSGYYSKSMWYDIANAATFVYVNSDGRSDGMSLGPIGYVNVGEGSYDVDLHYPFATRNTRMSGTGSGLYATAYYAGVTTAGLFTTTQSFDGIKLLPTADNITGTIAVYGYRK